MLPLWKLVQPLPRRRWLVVCPFEFNELAPGPPPRRPEKHLARLEAQRATRASAPNARVYDEYGVLLSEFWAGENIGYLQTTADGRIWCGWGDEGIFSDNVSSAGVGCLDEWGRVVFDFHAWLNGPTPFVPQLDLDTYLIAHCEALNVDNATGVTIAYWGTPTTLVRLFPDRHVQTWLNLPVDQPQAVVIDDQWALFSSINDTLVLVELDSVATTPLHVVDAEGNRLQIAHPVGRGSRLWFMADMRVL
jgi:hypothetical protein